MVPQERIESYGLVRDGVLASVPRAFFALPIPAEVAIRERTKPPKSLRPPYPNGAETAKFPGDCPGRSGAPR